MTARRVVLVAALGCAAACGDDTLAPAAGDTVEVTFSDLPVLDAAREGTWELWAVGPDSQSHSLGKVSGARFAAALPVAARALRLTLELPGDLDPAPAPYLVLTGQFSRREAILTVDYALTEGPPLEPEPGAHSLFTSSNNAALGYPSLENAGLWLFNVYPERNRHRSRNVKLTPLRAPWLYEGWIIYRQGTPGEVWISYGKFRPDQRQLLSSRDDTGSGPFSGDLDFRNGGIEDVPGDEWTTNPFRFDVPGGLTLPLALDAVDPAGAAVWSHAITIEPAADEGEPILDARPFPLRPYGNEIGAGGPANPRVIRLLHNPPSARAVIR